MKPADVAKSDLTVGYNSSLKLVRAGKATLLYVANDCAPHIKTAARQMADEYGVPVDETRGMAALQQMCGIDVGCAVCAVRRKEN